MKSNFILFVMYLFMTTAQAQNTAEISGTITDKSTNHAIGYANVLLKVNNILLSTTTADDNGNFKFKGLTFQKYTLEIQYLGFKNFATTITLTDQKPSHSQKISLEEEATELKGVDIISERSTIEQKIDRKVINVGKDLTTAGAAAADIMNNIPSVNIDQDGKLSMRGNSNVKVLIDGRPSTISTSQLLKQIPSSSIKKIELITNPSAKYNPEGMSGIINIILHKNTKNGFNGSYNGGLTFGHTPKFNQSINLNYKTGKFNWFANGGQNGGKYLNMINIDRINPQVDQNFRIVGHNKSYLYKLGLDYEIDAKNTISFYTNQNRNNGTGDLASNITYFDSTPIEKLLQDSHYAGPTNTGTYNLAYKHNFDQEGHTLDFEANYNNTTDNQRANFLTKNITDSNLQNEITYFDQLNNKQKLSTINVDYVNPISDKTKLELGAESRTTKTTSDYVTNNGLTLPENQNIYYTYDIDIYSGYATFGQKFEKFSYQIGTRFEHYTAKANLNSGKFVFNDSYFTAYPSAYLTYKLKENESVQLSFSRRVDRPSLEQTTPVRQFSTPLLTVSGNAELRPQFTNSVEANYTKTFEKGSFTIGVFTRQINDKINEVFLPDPNDATNQRLLITYINTDTSYSNGFEASASYNITKWWDIQPSIDYSIIKEEGVIFKVDPTTFKQIPVERTVTAESFNARMNVNFKPTKRLSLLLFGQYRGASKNLQMDMEERYKIDSGARYNLLNNKMNLSIRFNDMFNTMYSRYSTDFPFAQNGKSRWESRTVYIGLNYTFGGQKINTLNRKQRENNTNSGGGLL